MGDFQANFRRPDTGIHTVEGNVAGSRAAMLEKKRQRDQESFEERKKQIIQAEHHASLSMQGKFATGTTTTTEKSFKAKTIGLVSAEDFKKAAAAAEQRPDDDDNDDDKSKTPVLSPAELAAQKKAAKKALKKKLKEKRKVMSTLSFANEEELEEEEQDDADGLLLLGDDEKKQLTSKKDPTVDTSFLPDKVRDELAEKERQRLEKEWKQQQEFAKKEKLEIVYSYWDGSGHRRQVVLKKGSTIGDFLEQVRVELCREFRELTNISSDALMYVKEDLIIPQDLTFYDLIATKARGKSGPLFHFDVHDDVRIGAPIDSRIEKDESHPGKVVERRWYDRNKHIFPASRWEVFDPSKDYGGYTIGDKNKRK